MVESTNQIRSGGVHQAMPSLADAPTRSKEKPFNADAAMNAALNYNVDLILKLGSITLSMSSMMSTVQKTSVKHGQSKVEMTRKLLSAQGIAANKEWFKSLIKGWGKKDTRDKYYAEAGGDKALAFKNFCDELGKGEFFDEVYNNPNITDNDKLEFINHVKEWGETVPDLSTFLSKTSVITQNLTVASGYVQDWQSVAETMKPSQIQQAITTLIAEIGQFTSMWVNVIAS